MIGRRQQTYLVKCYAPAIDRNEVEATAARIQAAVASIVGDGRAVAYVGATLVPLDDVVFYAFEAESASAVEEASRRAGLDHERIAESIDVEPTHRAPESAPPIEWKGATA